MDPAATETAYIAETATLEFNSLNKRGQAPLGTDGSSLSTQDDGGIGARRFSNRQLTREQGDDEEQRRTSHNRHGIVRRHPHELRLQQPVDTQRHHQPGNEADDDWPHSFTSHHSSNVAGGSADRQPHTDLPSAL